MNKIPTTNKLSLCIGTLFTLVIATSASATGDKQSDSRKNEVGRFQLEPIFDGSVRGHLIGSWVIDTKTGRVRICSRSRLLDAPECSPWSKI